MSAAVSEHPPRGPPTRHSPPGGEGEGGALLFLTVPAGGAAGAARSPGVG